MDIWLVRVITLGLVVCHAMAPWLFRARESYEREVGSFGGGMAIAYVFLHLIPELGETHQVIGDRIYFIILFGFVLFYGLDRGFPFSRRGAERGEDSFVFGLRLGMVTVYNLLIVFTLGEQLPGTWSLAAVYFIALALHVVSLDHGLHEQFGDARATSSAVFLVASVIAGGVLSSLLEPPERVVDLMTALVAGFVLFNVFKEELPEGREAHFGWFGSGVLFFLGVHVAVTGLA